MLSYAIATLVSGGIFAVLALSLNLAWGGAGMVNLGLAGFFAVGAYASAIVTGAGAPFVVGLVVALAAGVLAGITVTFATLRLRDDYLAIVTLGFGEVIRLVAVNERWLTRGADGMSGIAAPLKPVLGLAGFNLFYLAMTSAIVVLLLWGLHRLDRSPYGRALRAVREDAELARFAGKAVLRFKFEAFALSAAIAGLAGALYAHFQSYVSPDLFAPLITIYIFLAVTAGGVGRPLGAVAGGYAVMLFLEAARFLVAVLPGLEPVQLASIQGMLIGAALLLILRLRPQGVLPERIRSAPAQPDPHRRPCMTLDRRHLLGAAALAAALPRLARAQDAAFRLGSLNPITGAGSAYGSGMQKMIAAVVDQVNAAGGAAGRKLQLFSEDTETQAQSAVLAAKKLIEVNKVEAMLGVWGSSESLAVIPMTNAADMVLMNTSGAPALSGPPVNAKGLSFRFQATNIQFGQAFAEICTREGFKRPATMAFNNASGIGNADGFKAAWEKKGGTVVAGVVYEPNQSSYASELNKVLAAKPDVIVTGSYIADTTIILRNWFETGATNKWILPGWAGNPDLAKAVGAEVTEGIFSVDSVSNVGAAAYKLYDAAYRKAMGVGGEGNPYAAMSYDQAVLYALAIEAAGPGATRAAVNAKVRDVAGPGGTEVGSFQEGRAALPKGKIHYVGASSSLDFDKFGDVAPDFGVSVFTQGKLERKYVIHP